MFKHFSVAVFSMQLIELCSNKRFGPIHYGIKTTDTNKQLLNSSVTSVVNDLCEIKARTTLLLQISL